MERLTAKCLKGSGYYMACSKTCPYDCMEDCDCEEFDNFVDRLGAIEDILGDDYDLDHLRELVKADRGKRCVVLPCEAGHEISYKSSIGLRCNAVIDEYTSENIFITAKTDIPNAEPLRQTFSLSEIEAALRREQDG